MIGAHNRDTIPFGDLKNSLADGEVSLYMDDIGLKIKHGFFDRLFNKHWEANGEIVVVEGDGTKCEDMYAIFYIKTFLSVFGWGDNKDGMSFFFEVVGKPLGKIRTSVHVRIVGVGCNKYVHSEERI